MSTLNELYNSEGQSPWIDNLTRGWLTDGHLQGLIDQGIRGVTSNPTIFAKSIATGAEYDTALDSLLDRMGVEEAYWEMVVEDIHGALDLFSPLYKSSNGADGFVSLEVSPALAHDTEGTITSARHLDTLISKPNLLVKIPATKEGIPAIRQMISEGRSINVTLIFSIERYDAVIEAYIAGLEELSEARGPEGDLSDVASVASFFVSRVDTEVDRRLETLAAQNALPAGTSLEGLRGKAANAQAVLAYQLFVDRFSGSRWEKLAEKGARVQRPLWASTSTKNPSYPDLLYVDNLIGPDTVNTMPDATVDAFLDHGTVARTIDENPAGARELLDQLGQAGIDLAEVGNVLEQEGVASFAKSFDEMLARMSEKANALSSRQGN